ncbi:toxin RelE2 [mine drainage metagenome]|uniref:Toxin RelE2 n=1 Tax=mine drainage metagenome TaxID=410659 RepID=A0A1J5RAK2_9ZZZZ
MQVKWLRTALTNLIDEADYIAEENPKAANEFVGQIMGSIEQLAAYPSLGRPGRIFGTRELVVSGYPYIIPYRVKNETVEILRIFHTSRRWPRKF